MLSQLSRFVTYYFRADAIYQAHSPIVYKLISKVVEPRGKMPFEDLIEQQRQKLLADESSICFTEYGAGSSRKNKQQKTISSIASASLSGIRQCRQLARLVQYKKPKRVLEMGTSLGISSMYLAAADLNAEIYTMEGDPVVAQIAESNFKKAHLHNIHLKVGKFEDTLISTLKEVSSIDLAFIDGNHRYEPTVRYFEEIMKYSKADTILVFDDIHWSDEMEQAWQYIQNHEAVSLTIDLFHMGIVLLTDNIPQKANRTFIEWRFKPWKIGLFG